VRTLPDRKQLKASLSMDEMGDRRQVALTEPRRLAATVSKLLAIIPFASALAVPAFVFEIRPNPHMTNGSVRIDAHDVHAAATTLI
jgi:hypothetical protein